MKLGFDFESEETEVSGEFIGEESVEEVGPEARPPDPIGIAIDLDGDDPDDFIFHADGVANRSVARIFASRFVVFAEFMPIVVEVWLGARVAHDAEFFVNVDFAVEGAFDVTACERNGAVESNGEGSEGGIFDGIGVDGEVDIFEDEAFRRCETEDFFSGITGSFESDSEAWNFSSIGDEVIDAGSKLGEDVVCRNFFVSFFEEAFDGELFFTDAFEEPELLSGEAKEG